MPVYNVPAFLRPRHTVKPVFLLAHDRSGSSWIADTLFKRPDVQFAYEPSHPGAGFGGDWRLWNRCLEADSEEAQVSALFDRVVGGAWVRTGGRRYYAGATFRNWRRVQCLAVKEVGLMLAGPFFQKRYEARIIVLVRHPLAVALSCINQDAGIADRWLKDLESQEAIRKVAADFIEPWRLARTNPVAKMLHVVAIKYKILERQLKENPQWQILTYEEFCRNPEAEAERILNTLQLKIHPGLHEWLESTTSGNDNRKYGRKRNTQNMPDKWKDGIDEGSRVELYQMYQTLGLGLYDNLEDWTETA